MKKALFIHRSVGEHVLQRTDIRSRMLAAGVLLNDLNVNKNVMSDGDGNFERSELFMGRRKTDPTDYAEFFDQLSRSQSASREIAKYDVLIIKSCYTIWAADENKFGAFRQAYLGSVAGYIKNNPHQLVVIATPPPMRRLGRFRDPTASIEFVQFLRQFSRSKPSVVLLDLFEELSNSDGFLRKEFESPWPFDQHPNEKGSFAIAARLADALGSDNVDSR